MFFVKLFLWTCGMQFWQLFGKIGEKGPKSFYSMSQNDKKYIRSSKNCFSSNCSYGQVECSFDNSSKSLSEIISCSKSQIDIKIQNFVFLLFVPMDKLKTVSTTSPKIFRWKAEPIWLNVRNYLKISILSKENVLRKMFLWRRRAEFRRHCRNFPTKGPKIFAQGPKKLRKDRFLKKNVFRKLFLWLCRKQCWHTLQKIFEKNAKKVFAQCAKIIGKT